MSTTSFFTEKTGATRRASASVAQHPDANQPNQPAKRRDKGKEGGAPLTLFKKSEKTYYRHSLSLPSYTYLLFNLVFPALPYSALLA